jgi:hypothetical protein
MMMEEPAFITIPYQEFKVIVQEVHSLRDQIAALEAASSMIRHVWPEISP